MPIVDDLLAAFTTSGGPRRALTPDLVPGDAPVQRVLIGAFWTVVVIETSQGPRGGLASALRPAGHHGGFPVRDAGHLSERSALELAA